MRFLYRINRCIGCGSCQVACKDANKLLPGEFFRRAGITEYEQEGEIKRIPFSLSCNHCNQPACMSVCPTGALFRDSDGLVRHNDDVCIGCGRCYWACPYGAISLSETTGLAQKCEGCAALRAQGREPACVSACPTESILFGDFPEAAGEGLRLPFLPEYEQTEPSTLLG